MLNDGYFVTGTDTGVGKTVVSAVLCAGLRAGYWKPVQTGTIEGCDSEFLKYYSPEIFPEAYKFLAPLSPHAAAGLEGVSITCERVMANCPSLSHSLIVEGAGGVLVPLNEHQFMIDLIQATGLPTIVVTRSELGTINHTLLTLHALRQRKISIAGIVMVGPRNSLNRDALARFGQVPILGEILPTKVFSRAWMLSEFRNLELPKIERPHRYA